MAAVPAPGLPRQHVLAIAGALGERVGEWELRHGGQGPVTQAQEAEAALLGPTVDNGNAHMARRGREGGGGGGGSGGGGGGGGGGGSHRLQFKFPVDAEFLARFPAEAERAKRWFKKLAAKEGQ
jgi:hypothetical protein